MTNVGKNVEEIRPLLIYIAGAGTKKVPPLWETVWQFLKILSTELPYDLAIPLLGILPKRNRNICPHKDLHTDVHHTIIHNSQEGKQHKCTLTDEWIQNIVYPHDEILLAIKRCKVHIYATTWTNLKNMLNQRSHILYGYIDIEILE